MIKRLIVVSALLSTPAFAGVSSVQCFVDGSGDSKAGVTVTFDATPSTSTISLQFKESSSDSNP